MTVNEKFNEHIADARQMLGDKLVLVALQGSQNYELDLPTSDVDAKAIVVPSFKNIAMNKKPLSYTHVRPNDEHIDVKDVRLYFECFKKQNINFVEILFTKYLYVEPDYQAQWNRLLEAREAVARFNTVQAVRCMAGMAAEKFHAIDHEYPSQVDVIAKYGYAAKQLHHILRIKDFLRRYIDGEPYEKCLIPLDKEYLKQIKQFVLPKDEAIELAQTSLAEIKALEVDYVNKTPVKANPDIANLLNDVQYEMMKIKVEKEFKC